MTTHLLVVETSPRGERSVSRHMSSHFVARWKARHPDGTVRYRDLAESPPPFVTEAWLHAYFTPPEHQSPAMKDELRLSDELVGELQASDLLVISTPVYNYNVPASLKSWVDHIVRKGLTLGFEGQPLLKGKRAVVLMASGGSYGEDSPIRERNVAPAYLRLILNVIGITDVTVVPGWAAKSVDLGSISMVDFVEDLKPRLEQALG
ncbi:MAG: NAD(P)H-dependent oxidoreductase [Myxococcota bacterium]